MKTNIIRKRDVHDLSNKWMEQYDVFAPVKRGGIVVFDRIHSGNELRRNYPNTTKSAKELLFPQTETLFTYNPTNGKKNIEVPPLVEERKRLLFGIRPCDARGFSLLDKVFVGEKYKDVYYLNRRANTLIVTIGCNKPKTTCFCTSVGGSPFSEEGSDLLLIDIGDSYIIKSVTNNGESFVENTGLEGATEDDLALMRKAVQDAETSINVKLDMNGVKEKLDGMFNDPVWSELTEKCLGCGICTYLCPTCHCFDIVDEATDSNGKRIRLWDSCQFTQFTQQASGFTPRPTGKERLRQRIMHKFNYFSDSYGQIGCVGCGRCIVECPVNLDIREVLNDILMGKVAK